MGQPAAGAGENAPPLRRVVHVRGGPASATQQYFTAADDFFIRPAARRQPQGQNEGIFYIFFFLDGSRVGSTPVLVPIFLRLVFPERRPVTCQPHAANKCSFQAIVCAWQQQAIGTPTGTVR